MAEKKLSQAERAAARSKKNRPAKKETSATVQDPVHIPARLILAVVCLFLFIFSLIMAFKVDGILPNFGYGVIVGLIGKIGFLFSIPALLYLFCILAFSGKSPVMMRSICSLAFVFCVGCIAHLLCGATDLGQGFAMLKTLYTDAMDGSTGGLLCGLVAFCIAKILSVPGAYIILVPAAAVTLLAALGITIPSIIRAYENRPKAEWEDEERKERPEPATVVVNHLANKRIEYIEHRRQVKQSAREIDIPLDGEKKRRTKSPAKPAVRTMMQQIDDIDSPAVSGETKPVAERTIVSDPQTPSGRTAQKDKSPKPVVERQENRSDPHWEGGDDDIPAIAPLKDPALDKVTSKEARICAAQVAAEVAQSDAVNQAAYCFPPVTLLNSPKSSNDDGTGEMEETADRLRKTFQNLHIDARVVNVIRGPSITRYEVELDQGVRLSKLTGADEDIALRLGVDHVRIACIPGKISVVGIEVPNRVVTMVRIREVIDSLNFNRAKSKATFAVGKDISGQCIVKDIAELPHMLIAGTTGSGKSVCVNSIIVSLLYKASPDDVKFIMIDPKMVELDVYNDIPHLLIPVITDPKKAAGSLQWVVTEMMRRYNVMKDVGVRDLKSYNRLMESDDGIQIPRIVVLIDELADLMMVAAKEVEDSIVRIAQMGRAAGIHLIVATQRPSADVITGLIKSNIPSRIAFSVASASESRIILDAMGAESLVGRGDMLFAPIGNTNHLRIQGCYISVEEIDAVTEYVKGCAAANYDKTVMDDIEEKMSKLSNQGGAASSDSNQDVEAGDEMLPAAVEEILITNQASVSLLQRRLKLGYARAARIMDEMEERGIVGPSKGSKPRDILITKAEWDQMNGVVVAEDEETVQELVPEEF